MLRLDDFEFAGRVPQPDGEGFAGGSDCGDRVRIRIALASNGDIASARFGAAACAHATAAAAWACRRSQGRPFLEAARASLADCAEELGLSGRARDCAAVALDALHAALGDAAERSLALPKDSSRIAVAMSGGVDSAVALLREHARCGDVVGLTLRLWIDEAAPDAERACCSPAAVLRARESCHALGIPHVTLDGREAFRDAVVEPFVAGYARGETPNPCTTCNGSYRLAALVDAAARLGAGRVATGHYARLVERGGQTLVARGADEAKDQSYMLARVPSAVLGRLRLPLGDATKAAVRAEAAAAGMAAATARESQDVCFLGGGALADFLSREGVPLTAGSIRDEVGHELGRHAGAVAYTPGQRRGLGLAAAAPLYVLHSDAARNELVVGPRSSLACSEVTLRDARVDGGANRVHAKLRARSPTVAARVEQAPDGLRLLLDEPVYGVAAGQTAALYDEAGCVIGSGVIAPVPSASQSPA
jgi:tRNA-specific 2-thiouridylase